MGKVDCSCSLWIDVADGFLKQLITTVAKLGQLIMTIGDFSGAVFIMCFILHVYVLIGTFEESWWPLVLMWFVGLYTANIMLIPLWHFSEFQYFKEKHAPWQAVLELFSIGRGKGCASICLDKKEGENGKYLLETGDTCWTRRMIWPLIECTIAILFIVFLVMAWKTNDTDLIDKLVCIFLIYLPLVKYMIIYLGYWLQTFMSISNENRLRFKKTYRKALCEHDVHNDGIVTRNIHDIEAPDSSFIQQTKELNDFDDIAQGYTTRNTQAAAANPTVESDTLTYVPDPFMLSIYGNNRLFYLYKDEDKLKCKFGIGKVDQLVVQGDHTTNPISLDNKEPPNAMGTWSFVFELVHFVVGIAACIVLTTLLEKNMNGWLKFLFFLVSAVFVLPILHMKFPLFFLESLLRFGFTCCKPDQQQDQVSFNPRSKEDKKQSGDFYAVISTRREYKKFRVLSMCVFAFVIILMTVISCTIVLHHIDGEKKYDYDSPNVANLMFTPYSETPQTKKPIHPDICFVKPFGLTMMQIEALATVSYYEATDKLTFRFLREFFDLRSVDEQNDPEICEACYDPNETTYSIDTSECQSCYRNVGIPILKQVTVKDTGSYGTGMVLAFPEKALTVFSIRGSFAKRDWSLDIQLFLSSALLEFSWPIQIVTSTVTPTCNKHIRAIMSWPLSLFQSRTLAYMYYTTLQTKFTNILAEDDEMNQPNRLYVGHSMGGGMAKLMSVTNDTEAVSLSGPGVSMFRNLYDPTPNSELDILAQAEIIPDWDIVPRFEVSAGARYRLPCQSGIEECHSKTRSICMTGILCNTERVDYCVRSVKGGEASYKAMKQLAQRQ